VKFEEREIDQKNNDLSLISNGAEVLMLRKDIFLKHSNSKVAENVRKIIQPYPESSELQIKLRTFSEWNAYKKFTMAGMNSSRKINI
jgi:hypothetical protein